MKCMMIGCEEARASATSAYCTGHGGEGAGVPEAAHARRTDPQTSHDAARSVTDLTAKQDAVLRVIRVNGPVTDEQIATLYARTSEPRQSLSGLRTRRAELVTKGLVVSAGFALNDNGRNCTLWRARNTGDWV